MSIEKAVSRRQFLRMVGRAGAVLGLGSGLGGLLAACDENEVVTNTTATLAPGQTTTTTTAPVTGTTATTVETSPEAGRPLRIGLVSAKTGPLALFGKADEWWVDLGSEAVREGIVCGDGKVRAVAFSVRDCRSDPSVAARMAAGLISDERVDLIMCSGSTEIVNGVAEQAETLGCPCLADFVQWQSFLFGRGGALDRPFTWTYAHAFGLEDVAANYLAMWRQLPTNKKVGLVLPDNTDGRIWADATTGLPPTAAAAGYECVVPGLYPVLSRDFTAYIAEFNENGCEICCCAMDTGNFVAFWRQARQQDFQPKIVTVAGGLLFPQALEAVGAGALNTTAECLWQPAWPYRDSLTGKSARELAEDYQTKTGDQWTAAIAQYAKFEWAVAVFKKARSIIDREHVIARVRTAKLETCCGPLDFTAPVVTGNSGKSMRPAQNVYKTPLGGAQWVRGAASAFEPTLVSSVNSPGLSAGGKIEPMVYQ
jgi:branched-chain amino acid transport system substrate-binding protein